jgi:hypothetical protein
MNAIPLGAKGSFSMIVASRPEIACTISDFFTLYRLRSTHSVSTRPTISLTLLAQHRSRV